VKFGAQQSADQQIIEQDDPCINDLSMCVQRKLVVIKYRMLKKKGITVFKKIVRKFSSQASQ
jgi:hypothetical protein